MNLDDKNHGFFALDGFEIGYSRFPGLAIFN